jgi:hypothetical protein
VGELSLALVEPAGRQGRVGQHPEADEGDEGGGGTLDNEQPSPSFEAADVIETGEDARRDEA